VLSLIFSSSETCSALSLGQVLLLHALYQLNWIKRNPIVEIFFYLCELLSEINFIVDVFWCYNSLGLSLITLLSLIDKITRALNWIIMREKLSTLEFDWAWTAIDQSDL
jgi:hypothetical protein